MKLEVIAQIKFG